MDDSDPTEIIEGLQSHDSSKQKEAAFRLQSLISDPSWTDHFIARGGLIPLRWVVKNATGNTLAYGLASFTNLLELDQGWTQLDREIVERLVGFVVGKPLINILRGAMAVLTSALSHPSAVTTILPASGMSMLDTVLEKHADMMSQLVSRLSSADHALSANTLQLINALLRQALSQENEDRWKKYIRELHDLGAIKHVYNLMQSPGGLQELAQPLIEFQVLTRVMLRKWRDIAVDGELAEHRRALRHLYRMGDPERSKSKSAATEEEAKSKKSDPERWKRLGFQTGNPPSEFEEVGYLGLMDLDDYVRKNEDGFRKFLIEQTTRPVEQRCPVAKASLAVTSILFDHFEIDQPDEEQQRSSKYEKVFKPMLLQWSRLHTSGLQAFFRLWNSTGAEVGDFNKIEELVRILIEHVVGQASRTRDVSEIEQELANYELSKLRALQMELLELTHEDAWGQHLRQIKDDLTHEALQFIKEQRIRCLLRGTWFPNLPPASMSAELHIDNQPISWRFVKLSHNRRHLHYSDFDTKLGSYPTLEALTSKLDINVVTEVKSDLSPSDYKSLMEDTADNDSLSTYKPSSNRLSKLGGPGGGKTITSRDSTTTTITLHGYTQISPSDPVSSASRNSKRTPKSSREANNLGPEIPLLMLNPTNSHEAAEWLDGLLMLLNQAPLTAETKKMVNFIVKYGLKIRMLNVTFEEGGVGAGLDEWGAAKEVTLPSREGVDEEFWYEMGGGA